MSRPLAVRQRISATLRARSLATERGLGLAELRARSKPGECPFCGDAVAKHTKGRKPSTCGERECLGAYHRYYKRDRAERLRKLGIMPFSRLGGARAAP